MKNLKLYNNKCLEDVMTGVQIYKEHTSYNVGYQLSGSSDIGKRRTNQEDSYIILEHPDSRNFKLLAVSDGVGGANHGEIASNTVVKNLSKWFLNLDPTMRYDMDKVGESLDKMLPNILKGLNMPVGEATLSAAIIGDKETLIVNIGDSRVYTYKRGKLKQETTDDSEVWELFEEEVIPSKELIRFKKGSNVITQAINSSDSPRYRYIPKSSIINNKKYDRILVFTDGVTDCLSEKQLEEIINESRENTTDKIVEKALINESDLYEEIEKLPRREREKVYDIYEILDEDYYRDIPGGKDNTTAVEYKKK